MNTSGNRGDPKQRFRLVALSIGIAAKISCQVIGWTLIVMFGPVPVTFLFAMSGQPKCQMACCKRARGRPSCERHTSVDSPSLAGSEQCRPNCSSAAVGFGSRLAVILPPLASREVCHAENGRMAAASRPAALSFIDIVLYQRPPPLLSFWF